jgi:hypothetical protein
MDILNHGKFYIVLSDDDTFVHETLLLKDAVTHAQKLANTNKRKFRIFESVDTVKPEEINVTVNSFESACKYLNRSTDMTYDNKHYKAIQALYKLVTIAEAWNKADNFVADFNDDYQYKYYALFLINENGKYSGIELPPYYLSSLTSIGARLCFKTSERAEQFGKQFIDLWNDFLIIK